MRQHSEGLLLASAEGKAPAAKQPISSMGGGDVFLIALYVMMIGYVIYRMFKNHQIKKKMAKPYAQFKGKLKGSNIVVSAIVIFLGGMNLQNNLIIGLLMVAFGFIFYFISRGDILIGVDGVFGSNNFFSWDEVKRWYWDQEKSILYLETKERGKSTVGYAIPCQPDDVFAINRAIRQYKLGK